MTMNTFNMSVGVILDKALLTQQTQALYNEVQKKPLMLQTQFISAGGATEVRQMYDDIKQNATAIESVTLKTETWINTAKKGSAPITEITQKTTKWATATGDVIKKVEQLPSAINKTAKSWKMLSSEEVVTKPMAQAQELNKLYEGRIKQFDAMSKMGNDYANRSQKWSRAEREGMQSVNNQLQEAVRRYKEMVEVAAQGGSTAGIEQQEQAVRRLNTQMETVISKSKYGAGVIRGWSESLRDAIKHTISYALSLGLLRAAQVLLNDAIKFTISLNTEMKKIQVLQAEGAQTDTEIRNLAASYNDLAQSMGTTTIAIAQGSVEWLRQGRTIEETKQLMVASTQLAKLGALSEAEATEYLTSTLNSYNMTANEAVSVVDRLVAVDNISATSTRELATALRYSAASAQEAGVSLEQLISYIAIISSTTRINAESVGQAMKTIFTRMQDIKAGKIDEDGLGINNVESALARVDIKLRDSATNFRDMGTVLEELALKWDNLNEVEQANISKAIAGVRQGNMFKVLMREMGTALDYQKAQYNSAGLAADRYQIYLGSVEAKQNQLKASMESLFMTISKFDKIIIGFLDAGVAITNFIEKIGGIRTVLVAAIAIMAVFNSSAIAAFLLSIKSAGVLTVTYVSALWTMISTQGIAATSTYVLTTALAALQAVNPVTWVLLLIGGLAVLASALPTPIERLEKLRTTISDIQTEVLELDRQKVDMGSLLGDFEKLDALKNSTGLAADEAQRLTDVQNQLKEAMPELIGYYDGLGNFIITDTAYMKELTAETLKNIEAQRQAKKEELEENVGKEAGALSSLYSSTFYRNIGKGARQARTDTSSDELEEYRTMLSQAKGDFQQLGEDAQREFINGLKEPGLKKIFIDYQKELFRNAREQATEQYLAKQAERQGITVKVTLDDEGFAKAIMRVRKSLEDLSKFEEGVKKGDIIPEADLTQYGSLLDMVGGKFQLNSAAVNAYKQSLLDAAFGSATLTSAQQLLVDGLLASGNAISQVAMDTYGAIISTQGYEDATTELAQSLWNSAQDNQAAFQFMAQSGIGSMNQLFDFLYKGGPAVSNFLMELGKITGQNLTQMAASFYSAFSAFINGVLKFKPTVPAISGVSGGGGGGGKSKEQKRIEAEIKALEAQKKALQQMLDDFKDYISAQKLALKLQKEEVEFIDNLSKKERALAKLRTRIAVLAMDNSEEAKAERLKLEEDAASQEEDITKMKENRKYDLQVEALDKSQREYEDNIKKQLAGLDDVIARLRDVLSNIGSVAGSYSPVISNQQKANLLTKEMGDLLVDTAAKQLNLNKDQKDALQMTINKWVEQKLSIDEANKRLADYIRYMLTIKKLQRSMGSGLGGGGKTGTGGLEGGDTFAYHEGGFAGSLKTNEEFAKLLKGEYVATEGQMENFMRNILPKLVSRPSTTSNVGKGGDISLSMPITVAGNLDKSVLPDLEKIIKATVDKINGNLINRGYTRRTSEFSV